MTYTLSPGGPIAAVPTNIVTGFLGAGKTSMILHLLSTKPDTERWAVLVNEFGEIGLDGSLMKGVQGESPGVFIREVPGGCMCCAAGLPMQIALTQLLRQARPDRLLIEPTGLGHPQEVVQVLSAEYNRDAIELQKIITLVDARQLSNARYTSHSTFREQIEIADLIVGNKADRYQPQDFARLEAYAKDAFDEVKPVIFAEHGTIEFRHLLGPTNARQPEKLLANRLSSADADPVPSPDEALPESGFLKATAERDGFESVGWRISPGITFAYSKLFSFLTGIRAERMKAVFITDQGVFAYNMTADALTEVVLDECLESKLEIIAEAVDPEWERALLACV